MRKQVDHNETGDSVLLVDGDMNHPVWQAAYAAAYAKIFVALANDEPTIARAEWHSHIALAAEAADFAFHSYIKMGGNVARPTNNSPSKKNKYPEKPPVHLGEVEVIVERMKTPNKLAIKAKAPGTTDEEGAWYPMSQIHSESEITGDSEKGTTGLLMMSQWYAEQKGLEDVRAENGKEDNIPF